VCLYSVCNVCVHTKKHRQQSKHRAQCKYHRKMSMKEIYIIIRILTKLKSHAIFFHTHIAGKFVIQSVKAMAKEVKRGAYY